MSYDPRKYWPDRLRKKGPNYVAFKSRADAFDRQSEVFWRALSRYLPDGDRVLDFGCGVGRFSSRLSEKFGSYDGVDLNEEALAHAPDLPNATFTYLDKDLLPFGDDTFDCAVALTVLQHIVDEKSFASWAAELARVIKPNGYFIGIETPQLPKKHAPKGPAFHMRWRTPDIIAEALDAEVVESRMLSAEFENSHYCFLAKL